MPIRLEEKRPARLSHRIFGLADALAKIDRYAKGLPLETAEAHPATAQMMIINPLHGVSLQNLFSTHPPVEQRIARLEQIASELGQQVRHG